MITYKNDIFNIETKNMSYIFTDKNAPKNLYYGSRIYGDDLLYFIKERKQSSFDQNVNAEREEYGFWNSYSVLESCLKVDYPEIRKLDMIFMEYHIEDVSCDLKRLELFYKNSYSDLYVTLVYDVYEEYDIISRYARIKNEGDEVIIENLKSASVSLPKLTDYRITYLTGKWAGEFQINRQKLSGGAFTIQSRCGNTGPHYNPSFAIEDGTADEKKGDVWFGLLGLTGNWQITFERTIFNNVKITGGINQFDFSLSLHKGEGRETPHMIFGFSNEGFGGMSRLLHAYENKFVFPKKRTARVLYNSWEATFFNVCEENQKLLADKAAGMGVELFVIDDGWFGQRNSDKAGLGDWYVNKEKFPSGLSSFIAYVKALGMDFGIWVEPEAVNPDSDLYREHPEWIYRFKDQEPIQARNQYTLNISRNDVKEYILGFMSSLLSENPDISFIKWDMNKTLTDVSQGRTKEDKELWYRHTEALYDIWNELRLKFPDVEFEACAGGGSRVDIGIMRYANQCWPSDNTDAFERLFIQEGFSLFYAPSIMTAWVTDASVHDNKKYTRPYSYRFHSSMMGVLGIGADISKFDDDSLEEFKRYITLYKEIRETIQHGRQYRLSSVREGNLHAVEYVSMDGKEAVVFAFYQGGRFLKSMPMLRLQGLEADAVYQIEGIEADIHGSTLMRVGIEPSLWGDFDSRMFRLRRL